MTKQLQNMQDAIVMLRASARYIRLVGKLRENVKAARKGASVESTGNGTSPGNKSELSIAELPKIAKTIYEISNVEDIEKIRNLRIFKEEEMYIEEMKAMVRQETRAFLSQGLKSMSQSDVSSSLQVYYNLGELSEIVNGLVDDSVSTIQRQLTKVFDHNSIFGTDAHNMEYITSSNDSVEKRQAALWRRLASCLDEIMIEIIRIWHLQRVIWKKRDPITHARFIDALEGPEIYKNQSDESTTSEILEGALSFRVWASFVEIMEKQCVEKFVTVSKYHQKLAMMVRETFINGFPRFTTILELFIQKLKAETMIKGSPPSVPNDHHNQLIASVAPLQQQYLAKTLAKLSEMVMGLLNANATGGKVVTLSDVSRLGKIIVEELIEDSGCSPLLNKQCHSIAKVLRLFAERCEYACVTDADSTHIQTSMGPTSTTAATNSQLKNIAITNALQELYSKLSPLLPSLKASLASSLRATDSLSAALTSLRDTAKTIIEPLMQSLLRRLETIISSIHNEDFDASETMNISGNQSSTSKQSMFATRLINAMQHTRSEYLSRLVPAPFSEDVDTGESTIASEMALEMTRRAVTFYCQNVSMLRKLTDDGRAKLATDMVSIYSILLFRRCLT